MPASPAGAAETSARPARRWHRWAALALAAVLLACAAPASAQTERADAAIKAALDYLYRTQTPEGTWATKYSSQYSCGPEALVLWAALSAGQKPDTPQLKAALGYVSRLSPDTVYARAVRCLAYGRAGTAEYLARMRADAAWLVDQQSRTGGWGYGPAHQHTRAWPDWADMSNTQLAILALAEAAERGADVPAVVWKKTSAFLTRAQNGDGGWGYDPPRDSGPQHMPASYGSMTAAGAASMHLLIDMLRRSGQKDLSAEIAATVKAGKWLTDNYDVRQNPKWPLGQTGEHINYYLHCLSRSAGEAGLRTIGKSQWRRQVVEFVLSQQRRDGSWGPMDGQAAGEDEAVARTCFAILCLLEAGKPVLLSKLDLTGSHAADHRDAAALARRTSAALGQDGAWQLLSPDDEAEAFTEAPILYLVGKGRASFPSALEGRLLALLEAGGTIVVQPDQGDTAFGPSALQSFLRLKDRYRQMRLRADHPAYSALSPVAPQNLPAAVGLGDSLRTAVYVLEGDLADAWRQGPSAQTDEGFGFFANIACMTLNYQPLAAWGAGPDAQPAKLPQPLRSIRVARVRHDGEWDLCPRALARLGEVLNSALSVGIEEAQPVDLAGPVPADLTMLWITGGGELALSDAQRQQLKAYVQSGGTVFIDSAGGSDAFFKAASAMLRQLFGASSLEPLGQSHAVFTGEFAGGMGSDVRKPGLTPALAAEGAKLPPLWCVKESGRPAVILSSYGLTCPMEGPPAFGCRGLATDDARRLAANIVLYAAVGGDDRSDMPAAQPAARPRVKNAPPAGPASKPAAGQQTPQPPAHDEGDTVRLQDLKFPVPR